MIKRFMPLILATVCALPLAAQAHSSIPTPSPKSDVLVSAADVSAPDVTALTAADREAFQLAQVESDPQLGDLRGGGVGLVVLLLVIILVVVLVH